MFCFLQLERDSSNPIHPLNKFSTGNKETLETIPLAKGIDVRKSLLAFHEKYYSSNIMTMAVEGKESLAELEQIVRQKFSAVPNRAAEDPTKEWWGKIQPYAPQASASILEVVPIGESRTIKVSWPIWVLSPAERANIHYLKPEAVISHLLGHEGEGSLRSLLVHKGWCNGLQSYVGNDISDLQMFEISIDLTPDGFKSRYEVVDAVFAFIDLIKINLNRGLPDYIIDELKQLSKMSFEYAEKSEPADYVSDLVANMQQYKNPTEYLAGSRLFTRFDSDFTAKYLSELTPENSRLEVVSGEFSGETSQVGRYYGTHYNGFSSSELTQRWKKISASTYPELILPKANAFIPHNFQIYSKSAPPKTEIERVRRLRAPPKLITSNKHWDLWYKLDDVFKQPKVYAIFQLAVAKDLYTPQFVMNSKIFSICLTEKLAEFLYEARLGGLDFSLDFTSRGVQITVSGFNDKFAYFFHKVLHYLAEFTPDEVLFRRVQEVMKRELDSWKTQQPYSHASYYTGLAIESLQFTIEQMKEALESCSSAGVGKFLKQALHKSRGTAMIIGNIKEEDARSATAEINKVFAFETLEIDKQSRREITILEKKPNGGLLLKHQEPNSNDANSAAIFYFQLASRDPSLYTYLNLLNEIVEQAFYNSLRTKQQLGYIVYSGVSVKQDVRFLTLAAQSSTVSGEELVDRIAEFLETELPNLLEELTSDEFHGYKEGITTRILEPDQRLTQQASRFWSEILSGTKLSTEPNNQTPMFDRAIVEAQSIDKIDLSDFREFVKNHILEGGKMRRLLVSEIDSKQKIITTVEKGVPSTKRKYSHLLDYISNEQLFAESAEKI